ncbi:MAG: isoprenyl transferase [Bacillota bacterium]
MNSEDTNNQLNRDKTPYHVAIIMDGNGRWAKIRGLPRSVGHKAGVDALKDIIKACLELDIKILSVFAFSTENWKRPEEEINVLMDLLTKRLASEREELHKNGVRINCIGNLKGLPISTQNEIVKAQSLTSNEHRLILNVALNYGGRYEIVQAARELVQKVCAGKIRVDEIDEEVFAQQLFTKGQPDPDLLIRPSGEMRLSNFFLWQAAYTEIYVSNVLWPDFRKKHLIEALAEYQKRDRRFGGVTK